MVSTWFYVWHYIYQFGRYYSDGITKEWTKLHKTTFISFFNVFPNSNYLLFWSTKPLTAIPNFEIKVGDIANGYWNVVL